MIGEFHHVEEIAATNLWRSDVIGSELARRVQRMALGYRARHQRFLEQHAPSLPSRLISAVRDGDFFDVMKLSDHRAGIFIADVMGHGARSALVTAILRTLLQDLAAKASDPAQFLSLLNRHFHSIIEQSNQFIFVSAFYLLIDTSMQRRVMRQRGIRRHLSRIVQLVESKP